MNQSERMRLLQAVVRVRNWLGRQEPAEFLRRYGGQFEQLIKEALPPQPRRRVMKRWEDLRPAVQHRLSRHVSLYTAKQRPERADHLNPFLAWAVVGGVSEFKDYRYHYHRFSSALHKDQRVWVGKSAGRKEREGTPASRLLELRLTHLSSTVGRRADRGWSVEFVPGLHPDDVELPMTVGRTVVAREVRHLNMNVFRVPAHRDHRTKKPVAQREEKVVAAVLFMRDRADRVEVWYAAAVHEHRRGLPSVEHCYIGRAQNIETGRWHLTGRYKAARNALAAANALYGSGVAATLNKEEDA